MVHGYYMQASTVTSWPSYIIMRMTGVGNDISTKYDYKFYCIRCGDSTTQPPPLTALSEVYLADGSMSFLKSWTGDTLTVEPPHHDEYWVQY